jgi:hypothetical protein
LDPVGRTPSRKLDVNRGPKTIHSLVDLLETNFQDESMFTKIKTELIIGFVTLLIQVLHIVVSDNGNKELEFIVTK